MTLKFFFRNPINNIKSEIVFYVYINYCQLATAKIDLSYIKTAVFYHIALYYSRSKKTFKKSLRTIEVSDFFDLQFTWFYMGGPRNRFKNTVYFFIFRSFLPLKSNLWYRFNGAFTGRPFWTDPYHHYICSTGKES